MTQSVLAVKNQLQYFGRFPSMHTELQASIKWMPVSVAYAFLEYAVTYLAVPV